MFRCRRSVVFPQRLGLTTRDFHPRISATAAARNREPPVRPESAFLSGLITVRAERERFGGPRSFTRLLPGTSGWSAAAVQARFSSTNQRSTSNDPPGGGQEAGLEGQRSEVKLSKAQQLRSVFKEYGAVGVCFHIGISLLSLGGFYLAVSSGLDMAALLCSLGFSKAVVQSKMAAGTSTFLLAYAGHKLLAPLRISITLVSVPLIVRRLRRRGLFRSRSSGH